jgi:hypothetical protein
MFNTYQMNTRILELSIQLFNAVPKGNPQKTDFNKLLKYGIILDDFAAYATDQILNYFKENKLSSQQLNSTFHKSWKVIKDSSREELFIHQMLHYLTTYGSNFTSDYVYFPAEKLELPEIKNISLKVIRGLDPEELIEKALKLLSSGIALEEETINDLLELLTALKYQFVTVDNIKNKEALVKIIAKSNVYPSSPVEFLRYLIFLTTESTLLIKNDETIKAIKESDLNISTHLNVFGLKKCAEIFNRFKPLWLAFKSNISNKPLINEISRLSKKYHKPMAVDVLNTITSIAYDESQVKDALTRVNNFRKIRLLNALNTRINKADSFLYRIRNGRSFSTQKKGSGNLDYYKKIFDLVYTNLVESLDLEGVRIKYPTNVDYSLPSSEKMFAGNFPTGTKITAENLVSGVYWEDKWGANDLDLSALSMEGKVGWNSDYQATGLLYSGDITDAPNGATELLYTNNQLTSPALSLLNIYSGKAGCKFKIIIGSAPKVEANYMFNPNELILEAETNMVSRNQILGIFLPSDNNKVSFVLVNSGFGNLSVSSPSIHSDVAKEALLYQYTSPISLRKLLVDAGAILVDNEEGEISLLPRDLQKDSIINIITNNLKRQK